MKTYSPKHSHIKRDWHLVDASDQILGRLSSKIAQKLIGKHKPFYAPHLDCGDYIVVINSDKITTTGNKLSKKIYYRHSGYPGGLKQETLKSLLGRDSAKVIERSVKGMLPKNKLQSQRLRRLKVFIDANHPYASKLANLNQQPTPPTKSSKK